MTQGLPGAVFFGRRPLAHGLILVLGLVLISAAGMLQDAAPRITLISILTALFLLLVYGPFIVLIIWLAVGRRAMPYALRRQAPLSQALTPGYLVYLMVALQLVHAALVVWSWQMQGDAAFPALCPGCGPADSWLLGLRAFYFSAVTFTRVGYGDIVPATALAQILALPGLWSPLFYLPILLAAVISGSTASAAATAAARLR